MVDNVMGKGENDYNFFPHFQKDSFQEMSKLWELVF